MTTVSLIKTTSTASLIENLRDSRGEHIKAANMLEGCISEHNRILCSKEITGLTLERATDTTGRMVSTTNPTLWTPKAAAALAKRNPDLTAMTARDWHRLRIEEINAMIATLKTAA